MKLNLNEKTKNLLSLLLRIGLSGGILIYLFHKIDITKMLTDVKNADFRYILLAFILYVVINFLLLLRWLVFIRALKLNVSFYSILNCYFIGIFFNLVLPTSTGGDIVKTFGLFKDTSEKAKVVASVVADRLSGFVSICLVALVAFLFGQGAINDNALLVSILILGAVSAMIILVLFDERIFSFFCAVFNKIPKIKDALMKLHYAMALLKDKHMALFLSVVLSSLSQLILAVAFYLVGKGLHQDIKLIYFFIFVPLVCVISSLPSIGGLGVREVGANSLFKKVGVDIATTVSITLINFLFTVLIGIVGGLIYVTTMLPKRSNSNV